MNKFVGLLIVIGLVAAAYVNRDKLAAMRGGGEPPAATEEAITTENEPPPSAATVAGPTPHPAKESQAQAARLYPGLLIPNSPLNKRFIALHSDAKLTNPQLLTQPDWPLTLADRAMVEMGGSPMPRTTPAPMTPKPLPGTAMDARPGKK